jgi:cytochrome P450
MGDLYKEVTHPYFQSGKSEQGAWGYGLTNSEPSEHAKRRSMIAKRYRKSEMHSVRDIISTHLETWIHSNQWSSEVDLGIACRALEADIICKSSPMKSNVTWLIPKPISRLVFQSRPYRIGPPENPLYL